MKVKTVNIIEQVKRLEERDKSFQLFGSNAHKYRFNQTLSKEEIVQFEMLNKVELPIEYREFLLEIGNGGTGPGYGMLKLEDSDPNFDKSFALLSSDFPYTGNWEIDQKTYDNFSEQEKGEFAGCLRVCFLGCSHNILLIVTGQDKGTIWYEGTGSSQGICPIEIANKKVSFFEWYDSWLIESLTQLNDFL